MVEIFFCVDISSPRLLLLCGRIIDKDQSPLQKEIENHRLGKVWLGWVRLGKVRLCSVRLD